jgi:hypothetical protein
LFYFPLVMTDRKEAREALVIVNQLDPERTGLVAVGCE